MAARLDTRAASVIALLAAVVLPVAGHARSAGTGQRLPLTAVPPDAGEA